MFSILGSICVGDKTSCGGTVVTGSSIFAVNGRFTARVGDRIDCKGNCVIVTGESATLIDGAAMAVHGSQTSGHCTCFSENNDYHGCGQDSGDADRVPANADAGIAYMPDPANLLNEEHWLEFKLIDSLNQPIPHQKYVVSDPGGAIFCGTVDGNGFARVAPVRAGKCRITFPDLSHSMAADSCPP